jgi:hypothetical protein
MLKGEGDVGWMNMLQTAIANKTRRRFRPNPPSPGGSATSR